MATARRSTFRAEGKRITKDEGWPPRQGDSVSNVPADPEPPIPLGLPKDLGADPNSKVALDWLLAAIRAHARLRAKSFYDTGHFISELLDRRAMFGAVDIKDLCSKVALGMSHMTANKYLQISRSFPRSVALEHGIEKCYALVVYARTVARLGEAGKVLAADESIQGGRGLRAWKATAAEIFAAIRALKQAARDSKVPPGQRAREEHAAQATERFFRRLGMRRVLAHVVRRGGEAQIALFVPLDVAEALGAAPAKIPAKVRAFLRGKVGPRPLARAAAGARRRSTLRSARAG